MNKRYDSTVARIAGNVASGIVSMSKVDLQVEEVARWSVLVARAIVDETRRTEPAGAVTVNEHGQTPR